MIERTDNEGIVTLRLAHGKASVLDLELVEALARAVAEIDQSDARAVILTGTGSIFSAGVDLFRVVDGGREYVERMYPAMTRMFVELFSLQRPVVAAVNGHAIAGGCILTAVCDVRLMARGNGRIGVPEMLVGVPFPPMILELLRFAFPAQSLQSLVYTGRTVQAEEALRMGIVDELVEPEALLARAEEHARQLAALPPAAFALAKRQIRDVPLRRARRYAGEFDKDTLEMWSHPDTTARIREYLDKTVGKK
jgi:enoyl-CoA hydratase